MSEAESTPEVGQIVHIKRGRDAGNFAIIIGIVDERFILLADGEKRKYDRAKKKNIHHVELCSYISDEVKRSIEDTGRVTNGKIRHALVSYRKEHPELLKEGK
ncbi:KOW domain-containing RNA-binding protein [Alteribacillus iranensis]|uniref:Ribosomal protein L14E/L6E/L27E n=1 Tax=Alteribacillus iranensis TaxID=930128 RepID=A0A1I2F6J0_9BACI|nr:KOW domain-containing RNA-binding protein [Alteribacillus iranensis]SFF00457.1 hypothetical protein SAMN05192532_10921 [Alteribacillus iranensis]